MDLGLRGKVALVTAASKGMGKACALEFAREGAKVAMCARTESDLKTAADEVRAASEADVLAMPADVTKKDDVQALTQRVSSQWGGVDILVANAGGPARGFFEEMSDEQWQQAFELSLLSVVRLVRGVLPTTGRWPSCGAGWRSSGRTRATSVPRSRSWPRPTCPAKGSAAPRTG